MNIINMLVGSRFQFLIQEVRYFNLLMKTGGDVLLKHSSPEQEKIVNLAWYRYSLPNPFSVGIIILLLTVQFGCGWSAIVSYFTLPVESSAILSLSLFPLMAIYNAFIPPALGRGRVKGLLLIRYFYLFNILLAWVGFFLLVEKSIRVDEWMKQLNFFPLQFLAIYLCRRVMNSNSFSKIIKFLCTTRLIAEAKKIRKCQEKT